MVTFATNNPATHKNVNLCIHYIYDLSYYTRYIDTHKVQP